jgi:hypothetical protein
LHPQQISSNKEGQRSPKAKVASNTKWRKGGLGDWDIDTRKFHRCRTVQKPNHVGKAETPTRGKSMANMKMLVSKLGKLDSDGKRRIVWMLTARFFYSYQSF